MEEKFCKHCGKKIPKDSTVCPKCGRQVSQIKKNDNTIINKKNISNNINEKSQFYTQSWFMWCMLIIFPPLGIFLMWKFHKEMKKNLKIILTICFSLFFIICISSTQKGENTTTSNTNNKIKVIDFSTMSKDDAKEWCNNNNAKCKIEESYSDDVEKNNFISQNIDKDRTIYKSRQIIIVYSLGAKPSEEFTKALKKAEIYSKTLNMSKQAIYDQLISYEKFNEDAANYAVNNMNADWNANALAKAKTYAKTLDMSKQAIYDQLTSSYGEKFTAEEAQYAIDNLEE